jgi:hypothetical protein
VYLAAALQLREGDRSRLEALTRMPTAPAGLVQRARILLLAAEGVSNTDIAARLGTSRPTVLKWRDRYGASGIESLGDLPRPGRPPPLPVSDVLGYPGLAPPFGVGGPVLVDEQAPLQRAGRTRCR